MKDMKKLIIKAILFIAVLGVILGLLMDVLFIKREDGSLPMRNYYDLPEDTVDALFLGSSHAGMNISMTRLWNEYGIAGYNCWASTQPIWNTYYYLKECLKTQTPKVVVMDVHGAVFSYEYSDYSMRVNNLSGLRFSKDRIDAVYASAPKGERADLLLELPTFHQRYSDLTKTDFEYFPWNDHAGLQEYSNETMDRIYPITLPENDGHVTSLAEKEQKYLDMIIELCRQKGVPLELVTSPYRASDIEVGRFNEIKTIAANNGIRFTDYLDLYGSIGIDPQTDFVDEGHFNKYGVPKYTEAIYEDILKDYDLPDRRTEKGHIYNKSQKETVTPVYQMARRFEGDGRQSYIDTGVRLFENPYASWTLLARITMPEVITKDEDRVIMACYDEMVDHYQGLLMNVNEEGGLVCRFNGLKNTEIMGLKGTVELAIVKEGQRICVYVDGEKQPEILLDSPIKYDGNLVVGCELNGEGEPYRFSCSNVENLEIYDKALYENTITAWEPKDLPAPEKISYDSAITSSDSIMVELTQEYKGDGIEKIVDTGVSLYKDPEDSWTILAKLDGSVESGDIVYFSNFAEDINDYRGILVRRPESGKLNIVYGSGKSVDLEIPETGVFKLAVRKDKNAYTIFVNDTKVVDSDVSSCDSYDGNLMLGCELNENGVPYRFSGTRITNFTVVNSLLSDEYITDWDPEELEEEKEPKGSDIDYRLETAFAGNGSNCEDTGMQLYDVPSKSWTLELVTDKAAGETGTLVSCFAEDPSDYRGLLIRTVDDSTFGITLGHTYTEVYSDEQVTGIAVTKNGADYVIYVNGKKAAEVSGKCSSYDGTALIGAERSAAGDPFRFSKVFVRSLTLEPVVKTEAEIESDYYSVKNKKNYQK